MAKIKFTAVPGLIGEITDNPLFIKVKATQEILDGVQKKLTITNKSISYRLYKAKERLQFFGSKMQYYVNRGKEVPEFIEQKCATLTAEIKKIEPLAREELFIKEGDGLSIPAGFWWLPETKKTEFHLNTKIKPWIMDGLRDYQEDAMEQVFKYSRATIMMATGLGKTLLAVNIAIASAKSGMRTMVIVPTQYLVGQTVKVIKEHHDSVTGNSSKHKPKLGSDIMVSTVQSAFGHIGAYQTVIIDEAHHTAARTWTELLSGAEQATNVYNLTATPFRADGMDLAIHSFGGPVVFERTVTWGIENGWLATPKFYSVELVPRVRNGHKVIVSDRSLATTAYSKLVSHRTVSKYLKRQILNALSKNKRCLVLFKTVKACNRFRDYCKKDPAFTVAHSKNKKPIDAFRDGKVNLLVSNDRLLSEGIDIPDADILFLLTQNSSDVTTFQSIGRVLRKTKEKSEAVVIDISVTGYEQFIKAAAKRRKVFKKIHDDVKIISEKAHGSQT